MTFRYFLCHYRVLGCAAMALVLSGGVTEARLLDVSAVTAIKTVEGIHRPTGCVAKLEFNGKVLIGAVITDPHCLPAGGAARSVPAFKRDFHLPAAYRELLRVQ